MTRTQKLSMAAIVLLCGASLMIAGCHGGSAPATTEPTAAAVTPATQPNTMAPMGNQGKPPEPPVALKKPDPASMTHMLTKEEPYYASMPAADAKSLGLLSKGTKVLVFVPGPDYSKVLTEEGNEVYAPTDGLDPISTK